MLMKNDLHDIDKLIKDGIENHHEELPPSAWNAVSADLDKTQAALYHSKYHRLKKAAFVLATLCFLSAGYIIFDVLKQKQSAAKQTQSNAVTPLKKQSDLNEVEKTNNEQKMQQKENNNTSKKYHRFSKLVKKLQLQK